jgi:hypothetical protein
MTMPEPTASRKPPRRFWLFAPYVALVIVIVVWSLIWLGVRADVLSRMDAAADHLRAQGYVVDWTRRVADGYPFRLDVALDQPRFIEPSGWGLTAPKIKAQAYAYNLDNWIGVAADGVTLMRPKGGPVDIRAQALRASIAGFAHSPPRISIEGRAVVFRPRPGASPFPLTDAVQLGLHMRPSGVDGAEVLLLVSGGDAPREGLLGRITNGRGFTMIIDGLVSKASGFSGRDWPAKAAHWAASGGRITIAHAALASAPRQIALTKGDLSLDDKGALNGVLSLDLGRGLNAVDNFGGDPNTAKSVKAVIEAQARLDRPVSVDVDFHGGMMHLGPITIGPAPKLY